MDNGWKLIDKTHDWQVDNKLMYMECLDDDTLETFVSADKILKPFLIYLL